MTPAWSAPALVPLLIGAGPKNDNDKGKAEVADGREIRIRQDVRLMPMGIGPRGLMISYRDAQSPERLDGQPVEADRRDGCPRTSRHLLGWWLQGAAGSTTPRPQASATRNLMCLRDELLASTSIPEDALADLIAASRRAVQMIDVGSKGEQLRGPPVQCRGGGGTIHPASTRRAASHFCWDSLIAAENAVKDNRGTTSLSCAAGIRQPVRRVRRSSGCRAGLGAAPETGEHVIVVWSENVVPAGSTRTRGR